LITYEFVANSTETLLEIGSTTPRSCGPRIDDVRVVLASPPKPSSVDSVNPSTLTGISQGQYSADDGSLDDSDEPDSLETETVILASGATSKFSLFVCIISFLMVMN
jgi:hypothetical protein